MPSSHESTFTISVHDLDKSLLPSDARVPNTDAFRNAVTDLIRSEYGRLGGRARVVIDDKAETIQVTWRPGIGWVDPVEVAVTRLKKGQYEEAVRLLEILRFQQPQNSAVFYNLGMAMSDMGRLDLAVQYLGTALMITPNDTNSLVGLGVALVRQQESAEAILTFRKALEQDKDNPWAHRNLGGCLLTEEGKTEEAEQHLRRAVELLPTDQQALFGLGQALLMLGREQEADAFFIKVIEQDDRTPIAKKAKEERTRLARLSFRSASPGVVRMDAVMYCLGALQSFAKIPQSEVQKVGFEIAILGQTGLDTNDSTPKYTLRSMPGKFSALHLLCLMHVAFKIIAPDRDIGFDLSREYATALALHKKR